MSDEKISVHMTPSRDESNCIYPLHIPDFEYGGCDRLAESLANVCGHVMEDGRFCNAIAFAENDRGELFCEEHDPTGGSGDEAD